MFKRNNEAKIACQIFLLRLKSGLSKPKAGHNSDIRTPTPIRGIMSPFNISDYDTVGIALTKEPNSWRITNAEYVQRFTNGRAQLVQNCPKSLCTSQNWKIEIQALFQAYEYEGDKLCTTMGLEAFLDHFQTKWVEYLYKLDYGFVMNKENNPFECDKSVTVEIEPVIQEKKDTTIYQIVKNSNTIYDSLSSFLPWLNDTLYHEYQFDFDGIRIQGLILVIAVLEKDGSVSRVSIMKSVYPQSDEFVRQMVMENLSLPPGYLINSSNLVRTEIRFPVRIKLK